ncbi:MAG: 2-C-methyl-D-erythritol 4-phosphate cytidylyltransferase [Candidatus Gastranaerophilales bacterium]|nr:2-C-methyl-D-erythritol 4-phosphate cytidylyltransferase [Candidatus Gastranaerophilales bacterium]
MNIALVLSGGTGTRLGEDIPKQYIEVEGRQIISYCLERLSAHRLIDGIQIVAASAWQERIRNWIVRDGLEEKFRGFSLPGENRQLSILHGLEDIRTYAKEEDVVLIHDAARPMLSEKMIADCLEGIQGSDGVIPVLPMKDTVYVSRDGKKVTGLLNRSEIFAGQAPEAFVLGKYLEANKSLLPERIRQINGSTESAILAGLDIAVIPGDEDNFKITTKADLERFIRIQFISIQEE